MVAGKKFGMVVIGKVKELTVMQVENHVRDAFVIGVIYAAILNLIDLYKTLDAVRMITPGVIFVNRGEKIDIMICECKLINPDFINRPSNSMDEVVEYAITKYKNMHDEIVPEFVKKQCYEINWEKEREILKKSSEKHQKQSDQEWKREKKLRLLYAILNIMDEYHKHKMCMIDEKGNNGYVHHEFKLNIKD
jgi:FixJ family two-component response regulator